MVTAVITENTTAQNATPDNLYTGLQGIGMLASQSHINYNSLDNCNVFLDGGSDWNSIISTSGLSNIPSNATITSATLYLKLEGGSASGHTFQVRRMIQAFGIATATWDDYDGTNPWNTGGALGDGTDRDSTVIDTVTTVAGVGNWTSCDVTSAVQDMVDGTATNIGFHLVQNSADGTGYPRFKNHNAAEGDRMELVVVYTVSGDTTPDAFSFTDQTDVAVSTVTESNTVTITGIDTSTAISVDVGEYRINAGTWTSSPGNVVNNDTVQVRHTSSASNSTTVNQTLDVGGVTDVFSTTTVGAGGSPTVDDINTDEIVEDGETLVTFNTTDFGGEITSVSINDGSGNASAGSSISSTSGDGTFTMPDVTAITVDTAGCPFTTASHSIQATLGDGTDTASLGVTYNPKTGYAVVEVVSATQVEGSVFEDFSAAPSDGCQVMYPTADSTIVAANGIITTDSTTNIDMWFWDISDGEWKPFTAIIVSVNDTTPDAFSFTDQTDVVVNTIIESNVISITGIDAPANISVDIGQYRINGGTWVSAAGTVENNDTVQLRHTSAGTVLTATDQVLTVDVVTDTFTSTTKATIDPPAPSTDTWKSFRSAVRSAWRKAFWDFS